LFTLIQYYTIGQTERKREIEKERKREREKERKREREKERKRKRDKCSQTSVVRQV
jgi:hypothetical protein